MTTPTRLRLALLCLCVLVRPAWAQHHGAGGHAGGSFGFHAGAGPSFGGQSSFRPSGPPSAPRSFYGSSSSYRGPFAPFSFRGSNHFVRPSAGFQHFRSASGMAARSPFEQGRVPRSAYLGVRNPRYSPQASSNTPSGRSLSGSHGTHLTAGNRPPITPLHGRPPVFPTQGSFFNPFFGNVFVRPRPFFFWPFSYPTFTWWWYPPLTFSNNYPAQGCPYDDYYYQQQRQPYYQPEEQGEAEQPAESAEEAANVPPAQPEEQTAPFAYETRLPDVIEWGKASEAAPEKQPAPAGQGPLVVNLPHHTLTIMLNEPSSLSSPAPGPAPPANQ